MNLKNGSSGEEVKKLQEHLGLSGDGQFGPGTEAAVKSWQASKGLTADGIIGPKSWALMFPGEAASAPAVVPASSFKLAALKGHVPDSVIAQIPDTAAKFGITNPLRLAHFLAQVAHESGAFKAVTENLNYSADGLKKIFPKYFPGNISESYSRNPEKIANKVYSARMGNGDEASGEGWKYRGRGYIQLTGKSNYTAFDKTVEDDILANPDLVATKYPLASAAFFFNTNKLWTICDKGDTDQVVADVTKRVNGAHIGLPDRVKHFREFWALLK
jgi:putative chitinase